MSEFQVGLAKHLLIQKPQRYICRRHRIWHIRDRRFFVRRWIQVSISSLYHGIFHPNEFPTSNIFKPPTYQSSVVASYIKGLGTTYSGKYNASGRGVPDIAAIAENVEIYNAGSAESVAGTSCATPISASLVSLINDDLIAAGKSPLGFINPFLYANPSAFTDITSGTNPGCSTNGFSAKAGWDPVTGLGSPVFSKIKTAAGL